MKKLKRLLIILLFPIFICSCDLKLEKAELIEISGIELTNNYFGENSKNFIFAMVNEFEKDDEQFLEDLKKLVEETNNTIYYVEYQHIDTEAAVILFNTYDANFTTNSIHLVENNELTVTQDYTNYEDMKNALKGKVLNIGLEYTSDKEAKEYLEQADKEYQAGNLAKSFDYINKIWNRKEAKEYFKEHPYLELIKSWEYVNITDTEPKKITYRSLLFYENYNFFFEIYQKRNYEGFERSNNITDYTQVYYYLKDDIIYTSDKTDGTYEKRFKIKKVERHQITLFDYKYKKEYVFNRRG
jgi:hypothetical protein